MRERHEDEKEEELPRVTGSGEKSEAGHPQNPSSGDGHQSEVLSDKEEHQHEDASGSSHTHHSTHHHTHSHSVHRHRHKHKHRHPEDSPLTAGRRKKTRAAVFAVCAAAAVLALWLVLERAEGQLARKRAGGSFPEREEEETELVIPRQVRGEVKLGKKRYTYDHAVENWLLVGTDGSGSAPGEEYHGPMADFLALAVFDRTEKTYALLQLDRNTVAEVWMMNADGSRYASAQMPLCTASWYGGTPEQGCENTVYAVSRFLGGLKIDGYYCLNMEDIGTLNRLVGGVEVTVEGDFSEADPSLKEGERVLLTDEQAVSYVRSRMNVGDGSNEGRMGRQRQYLEGFLEKVKERTRESGSFVNDLYRQLGGAAVTTMTDRDLSRLAKRVEQGRSLGILTLEGEHTEERSEADGLNHARFYADEESVLRVMTELYHLEEES